MDNMYLLSLWVDNAGHQPAGKFRLHKTCCSRTIAKWTCLSSGRADRELLKLLALGCIGEGLLNQLGFDLKQLCGKSDTPLQLELLMARHPGVDSESIGSTRLGSGLRINNDGKVLHLSRKECSGLPPDTGFHKINVRTVSPSYFMLAYGVASPVFRRREDFDFTDPFFRITRFHSLFSDKARLTHPVAFLKRLHYRGIGKGRVPAKRTLKALTRLFAGELAFGTENWNHPRCNFQTEWLNLKPWQQRTALSVLDMVRHILDAFPHSGTPLDMPGVILLDRPDRLCPPKRFPNWMRLLNSLLPGIQFILTLGKQADVNFPKPLRRVRLVLPERVAPKKRKRAVGLSKGTILLIDVDGRLPNLALMKLGRHMKKKGRKVLLGKRDCFLKGAQKVYASAIFHTEASKRRIERLQDFYGDDLSLGGSGIDLRKRLSPEIERLLPDYSLYPELQDRAIGFLTRGCPYKCPFCIVPQKEGPPCQVSNLDALLEGGRRKKLILLDDNILAHPDADAFLEGMTTRDLQVNFTQTLDLRLVTRKRAELLRRIRCSNLRFTRNTIHFSLNDNRHLDLVRRKYRMFDFTPRDNVEFICMYGYNTTLAQDVERFRFLRSLHGAYVFVQKYQPVPGGPSPKIENFFGKNPDPIIDNLVKILFPQNMKSMENYYRWVSRRYALTFGKLHMGLVDTIFRYNHRPRKGEYIATLAGTRKSRL
jgi:hypothetical protein